jgi:hypothetical protein
VKLQERSYNSKIIRPKPLVHVEDDGSLAVIVTTWGQPEAGQKVMEEITKYVSAAKADVDVTTPFEFLTCVPDEVNYVRTGILIANDMLYRSTNRREYESGAEVLAVFRKGRTLSWAQVGNPSLLIQRNNKPVQPVAMSWDLSSEMTGDGGDVLAPMPSSMIGFDLTCNIQCGHTICEENDRLILFAGAQISRDIWNASEVQDVQALTQLLVHESPEMPFWLGLLSLES